MRLFTLVLALLILLLQYPLWLGKGSWLRVWEVDRQVKAQKETNQKLEARNGSLDAEVRISSRDSTRLKNGSQRARHDQDEIFFQVLEDGKSCARKGRQGPVHS